MDQYRASNYGTLTPMVKNLLIINGLFFLAKIAMARRGVDIDPVLALFNPQSGMFRPWQILTHFFMHANGLHIFMNMFGLFMFGRMLEIRWGAKRFLIFYMITAFFAALLHFLVIYIQIPPLLDQLNPAQITEVVENGYLKFKGTFNNYANPDMAKLKRVGQFTCSWSIRLLFLVFLGRVMSFSPIPCSISYSLQYRFDSR